MIDSDLEQRLERMSASFAKRPFDTNAAWRQFSRLRVRAARIRRLVAVVCTASVVAGAIVGATLANHRTGTPPADRGQKHPQVLGGQLKITARIPQPGAGQGPGDTSIAGSLVAERGQVWGITYAGYVFRIDPRTNRVTFRHHLAGLTGITAGGGEIWVLTTAEGGQLLKLNPDTGRLAARFPLSRRCEQVSYGGSQLWLACGSQATDFLRIDPATGRVVAEAGPVSGVNEVAATPNGIWFSSSSGVRGYLGTAPVSAITISYATSPVWRVDTNSLVYGQGALWAFTTDESVVKIDPATGRVEKTFSYQTYDPTGSLGLDFMTVGRGSLWFLRDQGYEATSVLRVSIATGRPQGRIADVGSCGEPCWQIYYANGSIWVPTQRYITRIDQVSRRLRRTGSQ
jgi:glutamine cyclotransferase